MKIPPRWTALLVLGVLMAPYVEALGATNGVILIGTRKNQDSMVGLEYQTEEKGPGQATPGDIAMAAWLGDNGYSPRLVLDVMLHSSGATMYNYPPPSGFYFPINPDYAIGLVIMSGSSASADVGAPPVGIPVMMGEHVTLGNNTGREGSLFMYNGTGSSDPNDGTVPTPSKYMKIVNTTHPITQGIPLDAQGRVKIWREPYPEELAHIPVNGKKNYEWRWCSQVVADKAEGTTILGVLDGAEERSVFAVVEAGANLANGTTASARLVHMFHNENGSGGSRRVFLAMTELGRVLFLRAAKWAMGETLEPYQSFNIIEVSQAAPQRVKIAWQGSASKNYRIIGSTDFQTWRTVVDDIPGGTNGIVSRTLNVASAPQALFMRVAPLPN